MGASQVRVTVDFVTRFTFTLVGGSGGSAGEREWRLIQDQSSGAELLMSSHLLLMIIMIITIIVIIIIISCRQELQMSWVSDVGHGLMWDIYLFVPH